MFKPNKIILLCFFIIIIAIFILSVIFAILNINNENILNRISIGNVDVSNLSRNEAYSKLNDYINTKLEKNIEIYLGENENQTINLNDLSIEYSIYDAINEAFNYGRNGSIFSNNFDIIKLLIKKKNIDLQYKIDEKKLDQIISIISSNLPNSATRK